MKLNFDDVIKDGVEQIMENCQLAIGMTLKAAVEMQIPEKPKKDLDGNLACQCGFVVQNGKRRKCIYYCTYCGQALDWSDIE